MTSPSQYQSPTPSLRESESATLERLISHFVAAKRSLSATSHVYRANQMVDTARSLVEECAVLGAKNAFLERGANDEADLLTAVRDDLDAVARDAHDEFRLKVESIDRAHETLKATLDRLQGTVVDASLASKLPPSSPHHSLGPSSPSASSLSAEVPKTLHDFISEAGHQSLLESLRLDVDSYNDASKTFQATQSDFDQQLIELTEALQLAENPTYSASKSEDADRLQPIPELFHGLASQATETASLLQSLIEHYDLCSTALKHTEGGGEAARAATESTTAQEGGNPGMDASLFSVNKVREPITYEERAEMLSVVENDAQEVDDVVLEIRDRLQEMEAHLDQLSTHTATARTRHRRLASVLRLLHEIGGGLGSHVVAARRFTSQWFNLSEEMSQKMEELIALTGIYEGFLNSYALLLKEVGRRAAAEAKIRKVLDEAKRKVDALCNEELGMRQDFFRHVSDFMPRDIWADLDEAPRKWEWSAVAQPNLRRLLGLDVEEVANVP